MPRDVAFDEDDEIAQARKQAARDRKERLERGIFKLPAGETVFRILKTPADKQENPQLFLSSITSIVRLAQAKNTSLR